MGNSEPTRPREVIVHQALYVQRPAYRACKRALAVRSVWKRRTSSA
jgi:hypothetical protein